MSELLAEVRAQPWYGQVKAEMDAQQVPEYLWVSIIAAENPSAVGDATQMARPVPDPPGFSYGMFQLHNNPQGVDPVYSGAWAANKLGPALQHLGSNYTPDQALVAATQAAWPGSDPTKPNTLGAKEYAQRRSAMQDVIKQEGSTGGAVGGALTTPNTTNPLDAFFLPADWLAGKILGKTTAQAASEANSAATSAATTIPSWVSQTAQTLSTDFFIGSVIVAIIGGGFVLMQGDHG